MFDDSYDTEQNNPHPSLSFLPGAVGGALYSSQFAAGTWFILGCRNQPEQSSLSCRTPDLKPLDSYTPASFSVWNLYWADAPGYNNHSICYVGCLGAQVTVTQFSAVPEPSTYALLGTGLLTLGGIAAKRRKRADA